jgi:hypothetical protein
VHVFCSTCTALFTTTGFMLSTDAIQTTVACGSTEIYERQMHLAKYEDMLADHCKKSLSGPSSI